MQTVGYGEFSAGVHRRSGGKRMPMDVSIEVTRRCPLECLHCYNNLPMGDQAARAQEMTLAQHIVLLDQLVAAGTLWLLYSGGEIFARKDFLQIYTEAKKRGFLITLFTNGTIVNERIADYLAEWPPFAIEITLYGATRKTYEALTRIAGSYDRCMKGIHLLLDRKLPLKLKTVPTTINKHEVYAMKRMADGLGVEFKFDPLVNPRIDCSQSPLAVRLTPEEAVSLEFFDDKRKEEYRRMAERGICEPDRQTSSNGQRYTCGGGLFGCAIDPAGEMSICVISHQQSYNVRSGTFSEGWEGPLREIRMQPRTRPSICDRCKITSLCNMCAANGELENGHPDSPVAFLCEVAHLRAYALGFEVPEHGDCKCCNGGEQQDRLHSAAKRIELQPQNESPRLDDNPKLSLFSVIQPHTACSTGGCSSCTSISG